jgi:hypothetical protein
MARAFVFPIPGRASNDDASARFRSIRDGAGSRPIARVFFSPSGLPAGAVCAACSAVFVESAIAASSTAVHGSET